MKCGGAEDAVSNSAELESGHIRGEDLDAVPKLWGEKIARAANHVLGEIAGENGALRKAFGELGGQAAGAATGIKHGFVTAKLDAIQDFESPLKLRVGDGVISSRVPLFALVVSILL